MRHHHPFGRGKLVFFPFSPCLLSTHTHTLPFARDNGAVAHVYAQRVATTITIVIYLFIVITVIAAERDGGKGTQERGVAQQSPTEIALTPRFYYFRGLREHRSFSSASDESLESGEQERRASVVPPVLSSV